MGNNLFVDTRISQVDDLINLDTSLLKHLEIENEETGFQNMKVWRFWETENDIVNSEAILLPKMKDDHFLLSSLETYIILLIYKGKEDISDISPFPTSIWGLVESSSNMTPRGLQYAFSTSNDKSENLESFLLSKRDFKNSDFKYVLFIWNGKNCAPLLKSTVLMKAFDLDKKLSNLELMPYLYYGYSIKDNQIQKGKRVKLNEFLSNNLETLPDDNMNSMTPSSDTFFNYQESVYLLQWLYPFDKKVEKKSPRKAKRMMYNRFNTNFLKGRVVNYGGTSNSSRNKIKMSLSGGGNNSNSNRFVNSNSNTNRSNQTNRSNFYDLFVNIDTKIDSKRKSVQMSNQLQTHLQEQLPEAEEEIKSYDGDGDYDDVNLIDIDVSNRGGGNSTNRGGNSTNRDGGLLGSGSRGTGAGLSGKGTPVIKSHIDKDRDINLDNNENNDNHSLSNEENLDDEYDDNYDDEYDDNYDDDNFIGMNIKAGDEVPNLNLKKINLGDIFNRANSNSNMNMSSNLNMNSSNMLKVPKLNMKIKQNLLNEDTMSRRTKQISKDEEKLDTLATNTIRKASDIIFKDNMLKKLDFKNLEKSGVTTNITNISPNTGSGFNLNLNLHVKMKPKTNTQTQMQVDNKTIEDLADDFDLKETDRKKLVMDYFSKTMSEIIDGYLYLSSYNVAKNKDLVYDNGITHIINAASDVCENHFEEDITYMNFHLKDHAMEVKYY